MKSAAVYFFAAAFLLTAVAPLASAGPFGFLNPKNPRRIKTLIVTGNFVKSRMLAELIQFRTKQPILLLPTGSEGSTMYFLGPELQAYEVDQENFKDFVAFLQPKKVLFLGDKNYSPPEYIEKLEDVATTWVVNSGDWEQIAFSVEDVMRIRKLTFDYLVLLKQLEERDRPKPSIMINPKGEKRVVPDDKADIFKKYETKGNSWESD